MSRLALRTRVSLPSTRDGRPYIAALALALAALTLLLVTGIRPAAADHEPLCTDLTAPLEETEFCWIHDGDGQPLTVGDGGNNLPPGEYRVEAWGGGGGGGNTAGGGGGGGEWAMMELDLADANTITWGIGIAGPSGGGDGGNTTVTAAGVTLTAAGGDGGGNGDGAGGAGGGDGTADVSGTANASDAHIGGEGGDGDSPGANSAGGGGGGGAGPGDDGDDGDDSSGASGGAGGDGDPPGGDGGDGGGTGDSGDPGLHPGGGGGGGSSTGSDAGGIGAPGAVRLTLISATAEVPEPTVTKTRLDDDPFDDGYDATNNLVGWVITIDNTDGADDLDVYLEDTATLDLVALPLADLTVEDDPDGACTVGEPGGGVSFSLTCNDVDEDDVIEITVTFPVEESCESQDAANSVSAWLGTDDTGTVLAATNPAQGVTVPGVDALCLSVTKTPLNGDGFVDGYHAGNGVVGWVIDIVNDGTGPRTLHIEDFASLDGDLLANPTITQTFGGTPPDVPGGPLCLVNPAGGAVDPSFTLTCSLASGDFAGVTVTFEVEGTCAPQTAENTVAAYSGSNNQGTPLAVTNPSVDVTVPADPGECEGTTITKAPFGTGEATGRPPGTVAYSFVDGYDSSVDAVAWVITVTNFSEVDQEVLIQDTDVDDVAFHSSNLASECGEIGQFYDDLTTTGVNCDVPAGESISFLVIRLLDDDCAATNSLLAWLVGEEENTPLDLEDATDVQITVPENCNLPGVTKQTLFDGGLGYDSLGFNDDLDRVGWQIIPTNDEAIPQTVTLIDEDVDGVIVTEDLLEACGFPDDEPDGIDDETAEFLAALQSVSGVTCTVPAAGQGLGYLQFRVYMDVVQECEPYEVWNTIDANETAFNVFYQISNGDAAPQDDVNQGSPATVAGQACVPPTIEKTADGWANDLATWVITVDNTEETAGETTIPRTVVIIDAGATLVSTDPADACTTVTDGWECAVDEDDTLELTVTTNAPDECQAYDTFNSVTLYLADDLQTSVGSVENVSQAVPADLEACDLPEVRKYGVTEHKGDWQWWILIDNRGENTIARQVEITDPNVMLRDALDSEYCSQSGDVITCDVPADERISILVTRDAGPATCESRDATNSITQIRVRHDDEGWTPWVNLGEGPSNVVAEVERGEGSCIDNPEAFFPPHDPPTPGPGEGGEPGCATPPVPHATWSPEPHNPGFTISIWGGGNVSEFPLPLATTYWTLVDGEWVGFVPGIASPSLYAKVNAKFFEAFPNGDIPACQAFVIFHMPSVGFFMN